MIVQPSLSHISAAGDSVLLNKGSVHSLLLNAAGIMFRVQLLREPGHAAQKMTTVWFWRFFLARAQMSSSLENTASRQRRGQRTVDEIHNETRMVALIALLTQTC